MASVDLAAVAQLDTDEEVVHTSAMPTLPRRSLADAVAAASHGEHVTLTATDQHLTVAGADIWLTVATQLGCNPPNPTDSFTATVPTRQLIAELKGLPDGDIEITATQSQIKLRGGKRTATIAQQGRSCEVRAVATELWQPLSGALATALKQVALAAVNDEARPAVSGVRLTREAIIATDGARLHHRNVGLLWLPRDLTLPIGCVGAVCDLLAVEAPKKSSKANGTASTTPDFTVAVGANNIAFRSTTATQQRTLYARLAPEPFVEWRRILDAAVVDTVAVADATKLAAWLRSCPGSVVELSCGEAELRLRYQVLDDTGLRLLGEGEDAIEAEVVNTFAPPIKLSVPYLRDALAGCAGAVRLCWAAGQPLRLSDGDWTAVLMFSR